MRFFTFFFVAVFTCTATAQTTLVSWNFFDSNNIADGGIAANSAQTITNNATGTTSYPTGSSGTCTSPYILNSGWNSGAGVRYWQLGLVSTGYTGLSVSFSVRSSGTGPRDFKLQYSVTSPSSGFVDVAGGDYMSTSTSCIDYNIALPTEVNDQAAVYLRFIMTSNTSQNGATVASGGTNGLDNIVVSAATSLPVTLEKFRALTLAKGVELEFTTASERNNDYFVIERSTDGRDFKEIGQVDGKGDTYAGHFYTWTDQNPSPGKNYYRLVQVDLDGSASFSPVVSAITGATEKMLLSPSPANDQIYISIGQPAVEDGNWEIFNSAGQLVLNGIWQQEMSDTDIDLSALNGGMYIFRITTGSTVLVKQFRKI